MWWLYDLPPMANGLHLYIIKEEMSLTLVNPIVTHKPIQQFSLSLSNLFMFKKIVLSRVTLELANVI